MSLPVTAREQGAAGDTFLVCALALYLHPDNSVVVFTLAGIIFLAISFYREVLSNG